MSLQNSNETDVAEEQWLGAGLGSALLEAEQTVIDHALDGIFGEHLLQIGCWGHESGLIGRARTQHAATVYIDGQHGNVAADLTRLPFANDSVDAILLPHTLDLASSPHDVVREAHRVLRSDGQLMILGFKPVGLWGLRRVISRGQFPPGVAQIIGDRKLKDWLRLLDLRVQHEQRFFFRWPTERNLNLTSDRWESFGQRWFPELAACYFLQARKRVATITPIRPSWRSRARVVGGVAEPSLRKSLRIVSNKDWSEPK